MAAADRRGVRKAKVMTGAVMAAIVLTACALGSKSSFPPEQNVIYISEEGVLYSAILAPYDRSKDYYRQEELLAAAEKEASAYNAGRPPVTDGDPYPVMVEEASLSDGTARVVYRYAGADDLRGFTEESQDRQNHPELLEVTTVGRGLSAETAGSGWFDARKKAETTAEEVLKESGWNLIRVAGSVTVQTEALIRFYSGPVTLLDRYTARIDGGEACIVFK